MMTLFQLNLNWIVMYLRVLLKTQAREKVKLEQETKAMKPNQPKGLSSLLLFLKTTLYFNHRIRKNRFGNSFLSQSQPDLSASDSEFDDVNPLMDLVEEVNCIEDLEKPPNEKSPDWRSKPRITLEYGLGLF